MEEWHAWVRSQTGQHAVPHTGGLFLPLAYMFMPSLQRLTVNYALQQLGHAMLSNSQTPKFFSDIISLPFHFLSGKAPAPAALDSAMDSYMKSGERIGKDVFNRILDSNQNMMLLLVSVLSLYFQFSGMNIMREVHAKSDPERLKGYINARYSDSQYYNKKGTANPLKFDPVRIVYNTLVGLNHALFFCVGGESDDPAHEILHWTKALLYWEILARLLRVHGLGPLQLASRLLLQDLWQKTKSKAAAGSA
jgi:hypothetical protein